VINKFFAITVQSQERVDDLKMNLVDLVGQTVGGTEKYTGLSMKAAHIGMGIKDKHFQALVGDLVKSLKSNTLCDFDVGRAPPSMDNIPALAGTLVPGSATQMRCSDSLDAGRLRIRLGTPQSISFRKVNGCSIGSSPGARYSKAMQPTAGFATCSATPGIGVVASATGIGPALRVNRSAKHEYPQSDPPGCARGSAGPAGGMYGRAVLHGAAAAGAVS
jgi:hypothetical protein